MDFLQFDSAPIVLMIDANLGFTMLALCLFRELVLYCVLFDDLEKTYRVYSEDAEVECSTTFDTLDRTKSFSGMFCQPHYE